MGELDEVWRYQGGQAVDATRVQNQLRKGDKRAHMKDDQGQAHKVYFKPHAPN